MNHSEIIKQRLKTVMMSDRYNGSEQVLEILKCEITMLLESYLRLDADDVTATLSLTPEGAFSFELSATADAIIPPGKMLEY